MAGPSSISGRYDGSIPPEAPTNSTFFGRIKELVNKVKEFAFTIFQYIQNQYQFAKYNCKEFFAKVLTFLLDHVGNPLRNEIRLMGLELEKLKEQLQKREAELLEKIKELEEALEQTIPSATPAPVVVSGVTSMIAVPVPAISAPNYSTQTLLDEIEQTKKELEAVRGQLPKAAAALAKVERERAAELAQTAQLHADNTDLKEKLQKETGKSSIQQIALDKLKKQNEKLNKELKEAQTKLDATNPLMSSATTF